MLIFFPIPFLVENVVFTCDFFSSQYRMFACKNINQNVVLKCYDKQSQ